MALQRSRRRRSSNLKERRLTNTSIRVTAHIKRVNSSEKNQTAIGLLGETLGDSTAASFLGISRPLVRYHRLRLKNNLVGRQHGGLRWQKFSADQKLVLRAFLWNLVNQNPQSSLEQYALVLQESLPGFPRISRDDVRNIFTRWRWSWRIPANLQKLKYTKENMERYGKFVLWFRDHSNWEKVKFLDEVHFASKDLSRMPTIAPIGSRAIRVNSGPIDKRLSATMITNPSDYSNPLFVLLREDTNTQYDFSEFILQCIERKVLLPGDTLVLDNATIHIGDETFHLLKCLLDAHSIDIIFLPCYSPELNPAELVFNFVKMHIKKNKRSDNFALEIMFAFAKVDIEFIRNAYTHTANLVFDSREKFYCAV